MLILLFHGDNSVTFDDWCWSEYVSDDRLTGRCFASNNSAFCDRGNALYDGAEILYDVCPGDCDGENGNVDVIGQGIEPFEDRNCNNLYDSQNEALLTDFSNQLDCWNYELGLVKDFVFWILEIPNMMEKKLYGDLDECSYMGLYSRGSHLIIYLFHIKMALILHILLIFTLGMSLKIVGLITSVMRKRMVSTQELALMGFRAPRSFVAT